MEALTFDINELSDNLELSLPQAAFIYLFGSSVDGIVKPGSDIDIAVYFAGNIDLDLIDNTVRIIEQAVPGAECDLTVLNSAGVVVAFEALQGRVLFFREENIEKYASFYSSVCMRYEETIWWMNRQLEYRGYEV